MSETNLDPKLMKKLEDLSPAVYQSIKDRLDEIPLPVLEALAQRKKLPRGAMLKYGIPFSRHQTRALAMEAIYQHLLLNKDIRQTLMSVLKGRNQVDDYLYSLTIGMAEHEDQYRSQIASMLRKDWEFDRLSLLEQAILLMAFQEILENGEPKPVVINEAVTLAKEYCDDQSYKLINGVLDQL